MDQKLTLFTTADTHYLTGAVVTLVSAIKNCGPSLQLDLHLLQSGLSEDEKLRFKQTLAPFLGRHTLSVDDIDMELLHSLPIANGYLNALTYARLLIPGMFPDLDRALYLDSDIIVGKDLSALAELDMGEHLLAAVRDIRRTFGKSKDHEVFATLGFDPDSPYFAAGFLLMNLRQWRKEGTFQRCMEFFREHGKLFRQEDQTALNIVAHGRWCACPGRGTSW
jgi:lipopolysaccharide biosynthesis glycosyltransferase